MTIDKFFETLDKFYTKVGHTPCCIKFYAQQSTFSFEVHDSTQTCYTDESLIYESQVYWWRSPKDMDKIIKNIRSFCNDFKEKAKKWPVWVGALPDNAPDGPVHYNPLPTKRAEVYTGENAIPFFYTEKACQNWCDNHTYQGEWLWEGKDHRHKKPKVKK